MKPLYRNIGIATLVVGAFTACQEEPTYYSSDGVPVLEATNNDVRLPGAAELPAEEPLKVEEAPQPYMVKNDLSDCFFTEFGKYRTKDTTYNSAPPIIALGDIDGDGDADVAIAYAAHRHENYRTHLVLCENRMPQGTR